MMTFWLPLPISTRQFTKNLKSLLMRTNWRQNKENYVDLIYIFRIVFYYLIILMSSLISPAAIQQNTAGGNQVKEEEFLMTV